MKRFFLALIIFSAACSCSKEVIEDLPQQGCEAVSFVITTYTNKWAPIDIDTTNHWCTVCDGELTRYKAMINRKDTLCGEFKIMTYVTHPDRCNKNF